MKIVVDTNIVFSALLKSSSDIARLLLLGSNQFSYYSIDLLKSEISNHQDKLLSIGNLSRSQFEKSQYLVYSRIEFCDQALFSELDLNHAEFLTRDIDINDTLFVCLCLHLDACLWTGDKKLSEGLKKKNFKKLMNTQELLEFWLQKR